MFKTEELPFYHFYSATFNGLVMQVFVAAGFSLRFLERAWDNIPQAKACGYK